MRDTSRLTLVVFTLVVSFTAPAAADPFEDAVAADIRASAGVSSYNGICIEAAEGTVGLPSATVKIMPLGDSITQGQNTSYGSYRRLLYALLTAGDITVDFVGELSDGTFADPDHEGLTGFDIDGIWGKVDRAHIIETYTPDVILLLIGTNDVWHGSGDMPAALSTYSSLLDSIATKGPDVKVIVGSIPPIAESVAGATVTANVDVFNAGLRTLVASKGANFYFADINAGLTTADLADGVHPTDSGNDKLANIWYPTVMRVLSSSGDPQYGIQCHSR